MIDQSTTETLPPPPPGSTMAQVEEDIQRLVILRRQRHDIDTEISILLARLQSDKSDRPTWGPCTRCGHTWKGLTVGRPPTACPRCGSAGWNRLPMHSNARRPEDPPNPNWATSAERRRKRLGIPKRPVGRPRLHARPPQTEAASTLIAPPPRLEDVVTMAPPPRLEVPTTTRMVPSESVRFASAPREEPQPERTVSAPPSPPPIAEPDDGVPVKINDDGSITELPVMADDQLAQVEAVVEEANRIPVGVSFRGDHPPIEPDTADPSVDYVRVGNEWVRSDQVKVESTSTVDEQSAYEEAERGNDN